MYDPESHDADYEELQQLWEQTQYPLELWWLPFVFTIAVLVLVFVIVTR